MSPKPHGRRSLNVDPMEGGGAQRHPVGHPQRCRARDNKLLQRESLTTMETKRRWWPYRLCCWTTQLLQSTMINHLRMFGRHERCRATMWVSAWIWLCVLDPVPISCTLQVWWLKFIPKFVALHRVFAFVVEGPRVQFSEEACACDDQCAEVPLNFPWIWLH
jgi:hypothetical protein